MDPRRRHQRGEAVDVEFPVAMRVIAGAFDLTLEPLMDDQELDARTSVGTIYWRGYLELTGYAPLRL